jgi:hypothetical protein
MRKILIIFLLAFSVVSRAQNGQPISFDMPTIIPPSPEVAQLTRIGELSAGMHTGAANASIPLYELSAGSIKLPISLGYSSNGVKVTDVPGRAGLGWNIVAGGVISRIIHDEEDGAALTTYLTPPSTFSTSSSNPALIDYLNLGNREGYDTELDEFSISVNGLSGKFYITPDGGIHMTSHNNLKVEKPGNYFLVTAPGGTKYYFGTNNNVEKTRDFLTNGTGRWNKVKTTSWFLTKIETLEGDVINFNYEDIYIKTHQGASQSVILRAIGSGSSSPYLECDALCDTRWSFPQVNAVDYDTKYLSSITTSSGQQVYFLYQDRPDASGDNRLVTVMVNTTNGVAQAKALRHYTLEYEDVPVTGDLNQRFYLKKLYTLPVSNGTSTQTLVHELSYEDPGALPSQDSHGQDFFGYYNGTYNTNFFPRPPAYQQYERAAEGADRNPNFTYAVKGSLKKLTFPTGGYQAFEYEPHTLPRLQTDTLMALHSTPPAGSGTGSRNTQSYTVSFTTASVGKARLQFNTYNTPTGPYPGDPGYFTPDGVHELSKVEIIRSSDNAVVFTHVHKQYASQYLDVILDASTAYYLKLTVWGASVKSDVPLWYSSGVQSYWVNDVVCGIRVKKMLSYDPVSRKANKKFYTYASRSDLARSSGVGVYSTNYQAAYAGGGTCQPSGMGQMQIFCNDQIQLSSSGIDRSFTFSGSPVAYAKVIESDDSLFANGGIEHRFHTVFNSTQPLPLIGTDVPAVPGSIEPDLNGVELGTMVLKKEANGFVVLKEVEHEYGLDNRVDHTAENFVMRKKWEPLGSAHADNERVLAYDVAKYLLRSRWYHLDKTTTTTYDQDGLNPMVQIVTYGYGNTVHTLPTSTIMQNSMKETIQQVSKFPADFSGAPYAGMIAKHLITAPVETVSQKLVGTSTEHLSTASIEYNDWSGTGLLYKPQIVKQKLGAFNEENRLRYYSYDANGNPLEFSKENDVRQSYIWGYDKTYPIAKAVNASAGEIFFTSMEEGSGWDAGLSAYDDTKAHTGRRSGRIDPPSGAEASAHPTAWLQVNITAPTKFRYSGWIYSTAQNAEIFLLARTNTNDYVNYHDHIITYETNKWVYLEKEFTVPAGVIQLILRVDNNGGGTVWFDDLRLHPSAAQMTSYTYDAFVGTTSESDVNSLPTYYEYDGHNRLLLVRDKDRNIIKQFDYRYGQAIVPCPNTAANWQATGKLRCLADASNNPTGAQEAEERDGNNCSPTYLNTRWVNIGQNNQCTSIPGCTGPDKRVMIVNGEPQCADGTKVLVSSSKNGNIWTCTYRYVWSDGYQGPTFTQTGTTSCYGVEIDP